MKTLTCACCGSEVTCPQMYNGLVYGYTCIKKVDPTRKAAKMKFYAVEVLKEISRRKMLGSTAVGELVTYKVRIDGKVCLISAAPVQRIEIDGVLFLSEQAINEK